MGLQVNIFRREVILKVGKVETEFGVRSDGVPVRRWWAGDDCASVLVEELGYVERLRREERGRVVSQIIAFKIDGAGGREKPAFKDIAICVSGR